MNNIPLFILHEMALTDIRLVRFAQLHAAYARDKSLILQAEKHWTVIIAEDDKLTTSQYGMRTVNGVVHCSYAPAIRWKCGTVVWVKNDKVHRDRGAAIIIKGSFHWMQWRAKHSVYYVNGGSWSGCIESPHYPALLGDRRIRKIYVKNGIIDRDEGPAIIGDNFYAWFCKGKLHRDEKYGPALIEKPRTINNASRRRPARFEKELGNHVIMYRNQGKLLRMDGPALITMYGDSHFTIKWRTIDERYEVNVQQCKMRTGILLRDINLSLNGKKFHQSYVPDDLMELYEKYKSMTLSDFKIQLAFINVPINPADNHVDTPYVDHTGPKYWTRGTEFHRNVKPAIIEKDYKIWMICGIPYHMERCAV